MTLNGVMAVAMHYFTEFGSFLGALHKSGWRQNIYCDIRKGYRERWQTRSV